MKFESKYLTQSISKKYNKGGFIKSLFVGPFMTIGLWAIYLTRDMDNLGQGPVGSVIAGIKLMSEQELLVAGLCGIPMAGLIMLMGIALHKDKKIIVSLEFDNDSEILTIYSQRITKNRSEESKIKYSKLRIRTENKIYDGMSMITYDGIEFLNNGRYVGYLLKNHFTWTENQWSDICMELTKIGKAPR